MRFSIRFSRGESPMQASVKPQRCCFVRLETFERKELVWALKRLDGNAAVVL